MRGAQHLARCPACGSKHVMISHLVCIVPGWERKTYQVCCADCQTQGPRLRQLLGAMHAWGEMRDLIEQAERA